MLMLVLCEIHCLAKMWVPIGKVEGRYRLGRGLVRHEREVIEDGLGRVEFWIVRWGMLLVGCVRGRNLIWMFWYERNWSCSGGG